MHPYVIAPHICRITLDPTLSSQFSALSRRLDWRPLTTNLESCEDPPYLYFRIFLNSRGAANGTYAGFATGAPFMLTRDKDVKKRAFFLRHWVRVASSEQEQDTPLVKLHHMSVGAFDSFLLVRVDIDRPFDKKDTFKSVPFATWMFQVVQVDAVIQGLPGVRFAFAIERTVTSEERDIVVNSGQTVPAKGPVSKQPTLLQPNQPRQTTSTYSPQQPATIPRPARPLGAQPGVHPTMHAPPMQQSVAAHRPVPFVGTTVRQTAAVYQHNPYQYTAARASYSQLRQPAAPRAQPIAPHIVKPTQRVYGRPIPVATTIPQPPIVADTSKNLIHPFLKLWEGHDMDDPYEPIFITKDEKFDTKARRSVIIEQPQEHAMRTESHNLFGVPSLDYPPHFFEGPEISAREGESDIEIVVQRTGKARNDHSDETGAKLEDAAMNSRTTPVSYSEVIIAASEYNKSLREDRGELEKWLEEDAGREEEESEEEEEDEDADRESSE